MTWDELERTRIVRARIEYEAQPGYQELKAEAATRGYRPAYLNEMMDAEADLYNWRGGCWARVDEAAISTNKGAID